MAQHAVLKAAVKAMHKRIGRSSADQLVAMKATADSLAAGGAWLLAKVGLVVSAPEVGAGLADAAAARQEAVGAATTTYGEEFSTSDAALAATAAQDGLDAASAAVEAYLAALLASTSPGDLAAQRDAVVAQVADSIAAAADAQALVEAWQPAPIDPPVDVPVDQPVDQPAA